LIQHELAEKRLVVANPNALSSIKAYYLMIPERKAESASLRAFRDWLVKQASNYHID
jgi:DNA-binding transcriptional LysR family regulator